MTFEFSGSLLRYVDYRRQVVIPAKTLGAALDVLFGHYPAVKPILLAGKPHLSQAHQVFINGARIANHAQSDILQTPLLDQDVVSILTLITGG
jgi:sulfur-carrier protein